MASTLSLRSLFTSPSIDLIDRGSANGQLATSVNVKLSYARDKEMDVSTSASIDEIEVKEPSVLTMLMNFGNSFDPYDAMSTPLYQTATFKQGFKPRNTGVLGNIPFDHFPATIKIRTLIARMASTLSLRSLFTSPSIDLTDRGSANGQLATSVNVKLSLRNVKLSCARDKEMDVSTSASIDGVAETESFNEIEVKEPSVSTMLMNFGNSFDPYDAMSTPLYQTATFKQPSATEMGTYDYTRSGNPTRDVLEGLLAKLDKADRALCFTSGMAALAAVSHLVGTGEEIVAGDDIYGGSDRLLSKVIPKTGVVVKRVNTADLNETANAIGPWTKLVWLESPTNPRQQISDIRKISEMAHAHGAILLVDNSIMSPVLSQPLELGADIVMHSATKFIAGHSDVMAGVLCVKGESLAKELAFLQNAEGSGLAPFDCWICLRGIKTMALRVEKQQENAQKIAEFLSSHPRIKKVNYAGLPDHPGRALHYSQAKGGGSVLSFLTGSVQLSKHIVEHTKYFSITVSFGSVKSLISLPCFMSHASIPAADREARGLTEDLVRISVGIEDVNDLIADLDQAISTSPI